MLRGVNKNIVEITQTENPYFEKAILFIRPVHEEKDPSFLKSRGEEYLTAIGQPQAQAVAVKARPRQKIKAALRIFLLPKTWLVAAGVATVAMLLQNVIR